MRHQASKSELYGELKGYGYEFEKHYRDYTAAELQGIVDRLTLPEEEEPSVVPTAPAAAAAPHAAERAYTPGSEETPVRVDPVTGYIWYREEVLKPATPAPRARRKLTYTDPGTTTTTIRDGRGFIETVEIAGQGSRQAEVKITMPSYQVGVYKDPKLPFKTHVYNGKRGFDLFDVQNFYGGADLVPTDIETTYVGNDLCYDIRTTIREIEREYRRHQLKGFN